MQHEEHTAKVTEDLEGQRLDQVLALLAPELGLRGRKRLFEHFAVLVDGRPRPKGYRVQAGQVVRLRPRDDSTAGEVPAGVRVAGQSTGRYAALVKPAGLHTEAQAGSPEPSLEGLLPRFFPDRYVRLVNRLDRDTSGLVLAALSASAEAEYRSQEAGLGVEKSYLALAAGSFWAETRLDSALDTADRQRVRVLASPDPDPARHTLVTPLVYIDGLGGTLVRARIHRGARHQIRAHLAAAGHPLVGDALYGRAGQGGPLYLHHYHIHLASLDFAAKAWPEWPQWEEWSRDLDLSALAA
jgi:23S rRNA pseudouridine1911/1915/1917 synthase